MYQSQDEIGLHFNHTTHPCPRNLDLHVQTSLQDTDWTNQSYSDPQLVKLQRKKKNNSNSKS